MEILSLDLKKLERFHHFPLGLLNADTPAAAAENGLGVDAVVAGGGIDDSVLI